jgi:hypothetical protein
MPADEMPGSQGDRIRSVCMSTPPVSGGTIKITVDPGDTLSEIAEENGMSLDELLKLNPQFDASMVDGKLDTNRNGNSGFDPDYIKVGETILVRATANSSSGPQANNASSVGMNDSTPVGNPTGNAAKTREAMRYFQSQGWTEAQAAGIVANLQAESNLNPHIVGDGGAAYGLGQWHSDRQANFERFTGHSIRNSTFAEQLKFVQWELTHTESGAGRALKGADSAAEAAATFCRLYERPADIPGQSAHRAAIAQRILANS